MTYIAPGQYRDEHLGQREVWLHFVVGRSRQRSDGDAISAGGES
jgi:hypothetical protein